MYKACIPAATKGEHTYGPNKFERAKIGEALDLLSKTMYSVWNNITFSQEHLEAWLLVGDISDLNETPTIIQTDTNNNKQSQTFPPPGNIVEQLVGGGDDFLSCPTAERCATIRSI